MLNRKSTWVLLLSTLIAAGAGAQANLPPVHKNGSIEYLSGGIGSDEAQAVRAASPQWPLTIEFTVSSGGQLGEFAADVQVKVRDRADHIALQTTSTGPFLLIKLAPGHYKVDAVYAGKTQHQDVTVLQGRAVKSMFTWPESTPGS